jgi:prepilin-type N-terminal cleavage/methylation domain-containing protein
MKNTRKQLKNALNRIEGFTLIELLAATALVSSIIAVLVPAVQ